MTFSTVEYFKCTRCGEINIVSELNQVEEAEKLWSLRSTPTAKRKFTSFAAAYGLKAGDALLYLLSLLDTKENIVTESNRFGTPNTTIPR